MPAGMAKVRGSLQGTWEEENERGRSRIDRKREREVKRGRERRTGETWRNVGERERE